MRAPEPVAIRLDPVELVAHASTPIKVVAALLVVLSTAVWLVAVLKLIHLGRLRASEARFEREALRARHGAELYAVAQAHPSAPGARVLLEVARRTGEPTLDRLRTAAARAVVDEASRAGSLASLLGTVGSTAPFVGLFGTVYGIMDAFVRIGAEKSASLPVVAPAIGEALVVTAIGLAAAIPAVVFYNVLDKQASDLLDRLEASVAEWVVVLAESVADERDASRRGGV
jgi:biopolymer transport protein TolQ